MSFPGNGGFIHVRSRAPDRVLQALRPVIADVEAALQEAHRHGLVRGQHGGGLRVERIVEAGRFGAVVRCLCRVIRAGRDFGGGGAGHGSILEEQLGAYPD